MDYKMRNVSFPVFMWPTSPMMRHAGVLASRSRQVARWVACGRGEVISYSTLAAFGEGVVRQRKLWRTRPASWRNGSSAFDSGLGPGPKAPSVPDAHR